MPGKKRQLGGDKPPRDAQRPSSVPRGIEKLLVLASQSKRLRLELVESRDQLAESAQVELTDSEKAILRSIPAAQIEAMVDNMPPQPPARREFLRRAAASTVALLGGPALAQLALTGCEDRNCYPVRGMTTDNPETRATSEAMFETERAVSTAEQATDETGEGTGQELVPELQWPDTDPVTRGIRPDIPDFEPPEPEPEGTGGGKDPEDQLVPELPDEHHDLSRGSRPR